MKSSTPTCPDHAGLMQRALILIALAVRPDFALAASVSNLSFSQVDWYDESQSLLVQDSSWGYLEMDVAADTSNIFYFNLSANTSTGDVWIVRNLPVLAEPVTPGTPRLGVDFDITKLGLSEGTALASIAWTLSVRDAPLTTFVGDSSGVDLVQTLERRATGDRLGPFPAAADIGAPAGHDAAGAATDVIRHRDVRAVQEDTDQCLPGSLARSIDWLNRERRLGSAKTAQQIYADLIAFDNPTRLGYEAFVAKKQEYLRTLAGDRVRTKILDLDNVVNLGTLNPVPPGLVEVASQDLIDWLYREMPTEDVELHYGGHIVTLTEIYRQGGKVFVHYRDDETQNDNSTGDTAIKDAELVKTGNNYFFKGKNGQFGQVRAVISESIPEPASLALLGTGLMLLVVRNARRGTRARPAPSLEAAPRRL